jgi:hypothetical protein
MTEYYCQVEQVTPERAMEAMVHLHPGQRNVNQNWSAMLMLLMNGPHWHPCIGTPASYDIEGLVQNGVHRFYTIAHMPKGTVVPLLVARDMPKWAINHYDTGVNRVPANFVRYSFPEMSELRCKAATSVARHLMGYAGPGSLPRRYKSRESAVEIVEWVLQHKERLFQATIAAISIADSEKGRVGKVGTITSYGFVLYHIPESEEFFRHLAVRQYDGNDVRQAMTDHYGMSQHAFPLITNTETFTKLRIAELLSCWNLRNSWPRKGKWKPWNGEERSFCHPKITHDGIRET